MLTRNAIMVPRVFYVDTSSLRAFHYFRCQTEFRVLRFAGKQVLSQSFISLTRVNRQHPFVRANTLM